MNTPQSPQSSSTEEHEIILGTGMGPLKFGASMDEVRTLMGEPEEIEEAEDDDEFEHQAWNYLEEGYSLYFDREDDYRLSCIETDHPGMRLFGESVHGKSVQEVQELMSRNGLETPEVEKMDTGETRLSYEKEMIDLYFDEDQLQFVNFGVFINDDLEVQWPS
ncbi:MULTISPECIES: hypothetical protein [Hymenobacter]|uniref:Uncharacterized protein n=1 Tax=Hymenobacter jejuensis TaxID=2502781 RepID=A0A5B7ZY25_9BACT|nr:MULTISPECIES: hypothetical protein [Hymenobacter]MBC6991764.1 hypothetical protein [Hymenobacter sp. BT491]QDA60084.1 hypothetical protein FHG12_08170 [Hymenobacter jejuensis]